MVTVADRVREAQSFESLALVFSSYIGIGYDSWVSHYNEGKSILDHLEKARATDDPLERWELLIPIGNRGGNSYRAVGVEREDVLREISELSPKASMGSLTFDHFLESGKIIEGADKILQSKSRAEMESVSIEIKEIYAKHQEALNKTADALRENSDYEQVNTKLTSIEIDYRKKVSDLERSVGITIGSENYTEKLRELRAWREAETRDLKPKMEAFLEKLYDLQAGINASVREKVAPLEERLVALKEKSDAEKAEFKDAVMATVLSASPVTADQAEAWANSQEITASSKARLKKIRYPVETLKKDMAEFYRLVGGRAPKVNIVTKGHRRACANSDTGTIYLDGNFSKTTLFHEMGHILENNARVKSATNQYLDKRTGGRMAPPVKLSRLTGNKAYRGGEVAFEDDFFHPYVGKRYSSGVTEVCSMGMQQFATADGMAFLYEKDSELFQLILGIMKAPLGTVEKEVLAKQESMIENEKQKAKLSEAFYSVLEKKSADIEQKIAGTIIAVSSWKSKPSLGADNRFQVILDGAFVTLFTSQKELRMGLYMLVFSYNQYGRDTAIQWAHGIRQYIEERSMLQDHFIDKAQKGGVPEIDTTLLPRAEANAA